MQDYNKNFKKDLFSKYVKMVKKDYSKNLKKYNKPFDMILTVKEPLRTFIEHDLHYQASHIPLTDFIADCATELYAIIQDFEADDWHGLLDDDEFEVNKFQKYARIRLTRFVLETYKEGYKATRTLVNDEGEKVKVDFFIKPIFLSLGDVLYSKDGEVEGDLIETVTESYWTSKDEQTQITNFTLWFRQNRHRVLIKSQNRLIEALESVGYSNDDRCTRKLAEMGIDAKHVKRNLNTIRARVTTAWQKERVYFELSNAERILAKRLSLLENMMTIVETGDIETMNQQLSSFIRGNIDSAIMVKLVEQLDPDAEKEVIWSVQNKVDIISPVLYQIVAMAEQEITNIELLLVKEREIKRANMKDDGVINENVDDLSKYYDGVNSNVYLTLDALGDIHREG